MTDSDVTRQNPPDRPGPANLPPALTTGKGPDEVFARFPRRVRALAKKLADGSDVMLAVRTRTRIDVGSWLGRGRVYLAALPDSLALMASAPGAARPLAERIPFSRLRESRYNHVTGQLALSPAALAGVRGLALPPIEAGQVLAQIYHEEVTPDA